MKHRSRFTLLSAALVAAGSADKTLAAQHDKTRVDEDIHSKRCMIDSGMALHGGGTAPAQLAATTGDDTGAIETGQHLGDTGIGDKGLGLGDGTTGDHQQG